MAIQNRARIRQADAEPLLMSVGPRETAQPPRNSATHSRIGSRNAEMGRRLPNPESSTINRDVVDLCGEFAVRVNGDVNQFVHA